MNKKRRTQQVQKSPAKLSRLFREWYGQKHKGLDEMTEIWLQRGETQDEIEKARQDLAGLFNGTWITTKSSSNAKTN